MNGVNNFGWVKYRLKIRVLILYGLQVAGCKNQGFDALSFLYFYNMQKWVHEKLQQVIE